jgi:hypothetical protein
LTSFFFIAIGLCLAVAVLAIWTIATVVFRLLLGLQRRRHLAPDYLSRCKSKIFERDGLCFGVSLDREDGAAMFTVLFQNRYLGPAVARIALRPFAAGLATVSPDIECGPGGFGIAKFPVVIPKRHQGKTVNFEIGADVDYPTGKGGEIRFRKGREIRHTSRFRSLTAVEQPVVVRLTLPTSVAEYIPESAIGESHELWRLSTDEPSRIER